MGRGEEADVAPADADAKSGLAESAAVCALLECAPADELQNACALARVFTCRRFFEGRGGTAIKRQRRNPSEKDQRVHGGAL